MTSNIFDKLSKILVTNGTISADDEEIYRYGLQQGAVLLLNLLTILIIGVLLEMLWQSIVFMAAYAPLRSAAGGYHARTPFHCYWQGMLLVTISLLTIKLMMFDSLMLLPAALLVLVIWLLAPVADSNKPLEAIEVITYRRRARLILVAECAVLVIASCFHCQSLASCLTVALLVVAVLMGLGKIESKCSVGWYKWFI